MAIESNLPENLRRELRERQVFADKCDRAVAFIDQAGRADMDIRLRPRTRFSDLARNALLTSRALILADKTDNERWVTIICKRLGIEPPDFDPSEQVDEMAELRAAALDHAGHP